MSRLVIGSSESQIIKVRASCCEPGARIEVKDLAGNINTCQIGQVNSSWIYHSNIVILLVTTVYAII